MYSEDDRAKVCAEICVSIADGMTLREISRKEGMPALSTVFQWLATDKAFSEQYARAKEVQLENMAEEILEIADDATNDWMVRNGTDEESSYSLNGEHVQRARLRVDSRKWLLSKLAPKKYGDKVALGGDADAPAIRMIQTIERRIVHTND